VFTYISDKLNISLGQLSKDNISNLLNKKQVEKQYIDNNRFEQEIIYYLERLDITEEHIRLTNHCKYVLEIANTPKAIGKNLLLYLKK